jgi:hypothetical protein
VTALRGPRVFRRGDRLGDLVAYLCLYLDMQWVAFDAVAQRTPPQEPTMAGLPSTLFDVRVFYPIYSPFQNSFNPALAAPIQINIVEGGQPPGGVEFKSRELGGTSLMVWNMALVFFMSSKSMASKQSSAVRTAGRKLRGLLGRCVMRPPTTERFTSGRTTFGRFNGIISNTTRGTTASKSSGRLWAPATCSSS